MKYLWRIFWSIILDMRGEEKPEGKPEETPSKEEETPKEETKPEEEEKPEEAAPGPEEEQKPENIYEGYFDHEPTLEEVFAKLKEVDGDFGNFKKKNTTTEENLANLRKTLKEAGIVSLYDDEGNLQLTVEGKKGGDQKPKTKVPKRFTEDHAKTFNDFFDGADGGQKFLDIMKLVVLDLFDETIEERTTNYKKARDEHAAYMQQRVDASNRLVKLFPDIQEKVEDGKPNPKFNKKLHDRALEIYEKEYCERKEDGKLYEINPKGQLLSAVEAAIELGISPITLEEAKKAGIEAGKENKQLLGKVNPTGVAGNKGKLSKEEYLNLSPEDREKYDKEQKGIT